MSCERVRIGLAILAVSSGWLHGCGTRTPNLANPPDGGSENASEGPRLLATGQHSPWAIAIDDKNVYWFNLGTNNSVGKVFGGWTDGEVMRCNIEGCGNRPMSLASGRDQASVDTPLAFAANGGEVFWSDTTPVGNVITGHILSCSVLGCANAPRVVSARGGRSLAVGGARVFWTEFSADVSDCPVSGCSAPAALWSAGDNPQSVGIAVDASGVYWSTTAGEIMRCDLAGCGRTPTIVMSSGAKIPAVKELAVDANNVYFTDANPAGLGQILACAKTGCDNQPTVIASGLNAPTAIATDGVDVYWAEVGVNVLDGQAVVDAGLVRKCAVGGCSNAPTTVASGLNMPTAVAVDGGHVYWAEAGSEAATGQVWVAAK